MNTNSVALYDNFSIDFDDLQEPNNIILSEWTSHADEASLNFDDYNSMHDLKTMLDDIVKIAKPNSVAALSINVLYELLMEITIEICREVLLEDKKIGNCVQCEVCWKEMKPILTCWHSSIDFTSHTTSVVVEPNKDIFGNRLSSHAPEAIHCKNCGQRVGSSRYAAHLSNCMGFTGRKAGRRVLI